MSTNFIEEADAEMVSQSTEMDLGEYIDAAIENPTIAAHSAKYVLKAIEHHGTREVFEDGEDKERYIFFDDPYNDGEHAILGNTDILNDFVAELRRMTSSEGENEKIIWVCGPTATGKSEWKRCLVNGIRGFAETEEGARYTLEWTLNSLSNSNVGGMTYGDGAIAGREEWYKSPINIHPLAVFPPKIQREIVDEIDEGEEYPTEVVSELDPFSREAFESLMEKYDSFEEMISSNHLRVKRFHPDNGDGIGILHTEDAGPEKQRLVGSWMQGALEEFASRGRKNPQAFSYEGLLCQGNGTVSIVEDGFHHSDILTKMMNVCEEKMVKLDNKIQMELDTLLIVISNPDLEGQLTEFEEVGQVDPLRSLRRRMDKYDFRYLTTLSLEVLLLRRHLTGESGLWLDVESTEEKVREPIELYGAEISPHAIESAAIYEIATRLFYTVDKSNIIECILLLEYGEFIRGDGETVTIDDYGVDFQDFTEDIGNDGLPVTFTVEAIVEVAQENDVVLPDDILDAMRKELADNILFESNEIKSFENIIFEVKEYILQRQTEDVLEAMVGDISVTESDVREYIDSLFAWKEDDEDEYDVFEMREFETRYLGQPAGEYDAEAQPSEIICQFRESIIAPINRYMWEHRDEDYTVDDIPLSESPILRPLLEENDWNVVNRVFPDANLSLWRSPPSDTQTEELKEKTIERMIESLDYSEESAERVSTKVIESVPKKVLSGGNNGA